MLHKKSNNSFKKCLIIGALFAFSAAEGNRLLEDTPANTSSADQNAQPDTKAIKPFRLPQNIDFMNTAQPSPTNLPRQEVYLNNQEKNAPNPKPITPIVLPQQYVYLDKPKQNPKQVQSLKNLEQNLRAEIDQQKNNGNNSLESSKAKNSSSSLTGPEVQIDSNKNVISTGQASQEQKNQLDDSIKKMFEQLQNKNSNANPLLQKKTQTTTTDKQIAPSQKQSEQPKANQQQKKQNKTTEQKQTIPIEQLQKRMAQDLQKAQKAIKNQNTNASSNNKGTIQIPTIPEQTKKNPTVSPVDKNVADENNTANTQQNLKDSGSNAPKIISLIALILFALIAMGSLICWCKRKCMNGQNKDKVKSYDQNQQFDEVAVGSDREHKPKTNGNDGGNFVEYQNGNKNRDGTEVFD